MRRAAGSRAPQPPRVRRQQILGIVLIAVLILAFTLYRADWHNLFPRGWWRW